MLPFLDMSSAQALPYPTPFKRQARHPPAAGAARERPPRRRRPSRPRAAPRRPRAHLRPRPARGGAAGGGYGAAPLGTCPPGRAKGPARRAPSAAASPKPGRGAGPGPSPPPAACNRWSAAGRSDDPWRHFVCLSPRPFVCPAIRTRARSPRPVPALPAVPGPRPLTPSRRRRRPLPPLSFSRGDEPSLSPAPARPSLAVSRRRRPGHCSPYSSVTTCGRYHWRAEDAPPRPRRPPPRRRWPRARREGRRQSGSRRARCGAASVGAAVGEMAPAGRRAGAGPAARTRAAGPGASLRSAPRHGRLHSGPCGAPPPSWFEGA